MRDRTLGIRDAARPAPDRLLTDIADYVLGVAPVNDEARSMARYTLMDALGCALLSLNFPACTRLLGPVVPGADLHCGARVPGTRFELDPVRAAFNIGAMIRWLDFNDTWLAAEWGHPSDNLGAILAVADYMARNTRCDCGEVPTMRDVLSATIMAHEIQGVLALDHSFNEVGLDHVLLVRIASTAVAGRLLGLDHDAIVNAVSNAWLDGGALRTYRHAPNTGSRKSWAAGDATSRAVFLALLAGRGEMGYPSALSAATWGFQDVLFRGRSIEFGVRPGSLVIENVLFKIGFPAEFHAQTAVEAAVSLHPLVADRFDEIDRVVIETQQAACRIIDKTGPLANAADRDHCLQFMVAVALLRGSLDAGDYEDESSADPRIDPLRSIMTVVENQRYSAEYLDPEKRSIGNSVQVFFKDGSATPQIQIDYPLGHPRRRAEGLPWLIEKFRKNAGTRLSSKRVSGIEEMFFELEELEATPVDVFVSRFLPEE